ncbi:MAG: serine/threonine protein kinase, partial [Nannocystaceae bacterium]|nr:serine/threonine protein kinase [Nannocystaceae bacterium]
MLPCTLGLTVDCPDEDEIVAYAQGHLGGLARQRLAAHVDGCAVCVALVAEAVRGEVTRREDEPAIGDDPLRPALTRGRSLGRYLVLAPLGEGGLGRVVAAYDPQLDRRVAIKLLDPRAHRGLTAEQLRARLLREAQALAKLRHPNVVAVHDVGMTEDEPTLVFLAMELVEGATLREWLHQGPRSWPEIRDVFVAAARGLDAAHAAGLVHRDVKPGNILVGNDGRVQVVDFGLARALDRDASSAQGSGVAPAIDDGLSRASGLVGTPAYMAPEQMQRGRVDARTDQFGLCVALFEALWGARPFAGATLEQLHAAVLAGAVVETPARGVPAWLRRVVLRGLATDPAQRWPAMDALIDALQQDRRHRRGRAIAAAGGLLSLGAAGWALVLAPMLAPDAGATAEIDALAEQARAAAAKAHFAHPPFDEPDRPTAYTKVLELEALTGEAESLADARAAELRDEFAATLVGLGDHYWDLAQGRPFAAEYYAAALVFDDDHPRALSRIGSSIAAIMALREHAATLSFVPEELIAVAPSQALATTDPRERARRLEAAYAHVPEPPAALTVALEAVLDERDRSAVRRGRARQRVDAPAMLARADDAPAPVVADAAVPARAVPSPSLDAGA